MEEGRGAIPRPLYCYEISTITLTISSIVSELYLLISFTQG